MSENYPLNQSTSLTQDETETGRLKQEVKSLRDQLHRSLAELKAYQTKYPSAYIHDVKLDENLPPWITSSEIMTPILEAYDSRIKELESIATQQAMQLDKLRQKVQNVVHENEELREVNLNSATGRIGGGNLRDSTKEFRPSSVSTSATIGDNEYYNDGNENDNTSSNKATLGGPLKEELVMELNERLEILMTENALMNEQKGLLTEELDAFQQELDQRTQELDDVSHRYITLERQFSHLQILFQQAEKDRDTAATKAIHFSESLGHLQAQYDVIKDENNNIKRKMNQFEKAFKDEQFKYQQYKSEVEKEGIDCVLLAQKAEDRAQDLKNQLSVKTSENDNTQEILRKLRREYLATRQDAEGMLQVMSGLEHQVADYAAKEEEMSRFNKQCKEKVDEAFNIRDQAIVREEQMKKEVMRLVEQRKQYQLGRENEIEIAVEASRKIATDRMLSLERDLSVLADSLGTRQAESEIAFREARSMKDQLEKCITLRDNERKIATDAIQELEMKITSLVHENTMETNHAKEAQNKNTHYRSTIDSLRNQLDDMKLQLIQLQKSKENESMTLKSMIRDHQRESTEKSRILTKVERELQDVKEKFKFDVIGIERRLGDENKGLRRRVAESERTVRELEQNLEMDGVRRSHLVEQVKGSTSAVVSQLESQLMEEKENARDVLLNKREQEIRLETLIQEHHDLSQVVTEADKTISMLEKELTDARRMVVDLTQQLSESFEARKKGALAAARRMERLGMDVTAIYSDTEWIHDNNNNNDNDDDDDDDKSQRFEYTHASDSQDSNNDSDLDIHDNPKDTSLLTKKAQIKLLKRIDESNKKISKSKLIIKQKHELAEALLDKKLADLRKRININTNKKSKIKGRGSDNMNNTNEIGEGSKYNINSNDDNNNDDNDDDDNDDELDGTSSSSSSEKEVI